MNLPTYTPIPLRWWCVAVVALAGWNGCLALYAGPESMTQGYDGTQYQLLARNRLAGHEEVGDTAHTVRREGAHPMWRPGLVWLTEGLARCLGSVRQAAIIASVVGTTLLELALLWLTWRCFGRGAWSMVLVLYFLPFAISVVFLRLAIGQGPEPWATAMTVIGLCLWWEALARSSWWLALLAAVSAGSAELFRTGNILLFVAPILISLLFALGQRSYRSVGLCALALTGYFGVTVGVGQLVASPVNKTVANLWGNLVEYQGIQVAAQHPNGSRPIHFIGGLRLVPGTSETYYDYIVHQSRYTSSTFWNDHGQEIIALYQERLWQQAEEGARGTRAMAGDWTLIFFLLSLVITAIRPDPATLPRLALAGGFLGHLLGPVTLLCGAEPTHYLIPALPLLVAVAAGGVILIGSRLVEWLDRGRGTLAGLLWQGRNAMITGLVIILTWFTYQFYSGALLCVASDYAEAQQDQTEIDALYLEGRKIAIRHMVCFVDRDVETVLLPYATVAELESYVDAHHLDGILFRSESRHPIFSVTPYESLAAFEKALQKSTQFAPPRASGLWRYYAVRRLPSEGQP